MVPGDVFEPQVLDTISWRELLGSCEHDHWEIKEKQARHIKQSMIWEIRNWTHLIMQSSFCLQIQITSVWEDSWANIWTATEKPIAGAATHHSQPLVWGSPPWCRSGSYTGPSPPPSQTPLPWTTASYTSSTQNMPSGMRFPSHGAPSRWRISAAHSGHT